MTVELSLRTKTRKLLQAKMIIRKRFNDFLMFYAVDSGRKKKSHTFCGEIRQRYKNDHDT